MITILRSAVAATRSGYTTSIEYSLSGSCTVPTGVGFPNVQYYTNEKTYKGVKTRTFMVLSQEPVAKIPPVGVSIHLTHLIGLSCCATCDDCPF